MKIFSTKVHGFLDYFMSAILLVAPTVLSLDKENVEGMLFYVIGVLLLIYSFLTNYELGAVKLIPMKWHLALDVLSGIFLAASPWLFGFENQIFIPFIVLGVAEIVAGLTTTSQVGVPEMQQIIATPTITIEVVGDKPEKKPTQRKTAPKKVVTQKAVTATKKETPKHSITESNKVVKVKKTVPEAKKPPVAVKKKENIKPDAKKGGGNA